MNISPFKDPIFVTRPVLPNKQEFDRLTAEIWDAAWLTNMGAQHVALEADLKKYLSVPNITLFNNGTIALMSALSSLKLQGEVITTPFTFAATPHAISWQGLTPVFCDIDPGTLTLAPEKIEKLITKRTAAIVAVHVYGQPCDVFFIDKIAKNYGIKVIYDAAHAFGAEIEGKSIGLYGDVTMFSFHATKLFHSAEGGALVSPHADIKRDFDKIKNFGILNENEVDGVGLNGKMTELSAAMGRLVLKMVDEERAAREKVLSNYAENLSQVRGIQLFQPRGLSKNSYQYLVIKIDQEQYGHSRDELFQELRKYNVIARRYFYPLCSNFSCYRDLPTADSSQLPIANRISDSVLALPFYGTLSEREIDTICEIIKRLGRK